MIARTRHSQIVQDLLTRHPVVALLGARQVGKTTLARTLVELQAGPVTLFDLEDPVDLARLEDPGLALRPLKGLVVLDEAQRRPDVFPLLRVLADRPDLPARFLLLGSSSPDLVGRISESLAGRVAFHTLWNGAEFGRAFGVSGHTVRRHLDVLVGTYVVRLLQPWHQNLAKRQVRSPKVYLGDPGMLHMLLGISQFDGLLGHPKVGVSWEGFALDVVLRRLGAREEESFFWATHAGAELDLLVVRGTTRLGFEFKRSEAPVMTASMRRALEDLELDHLVVVHAGTRDYPVADRTDALALAHVQTGLAQLMQGSAIVPQTPRPIAAWRTWSGGWHGAPRVLLV